MPLPGADGRARQRLGVAAGDQSVRQRRPFGRCLRPDARLDRAVQQVAEEATRRARFFGFRQWVQLRHFHPAGQGFSYGGHQQQIGRAGQHETTRTAVLIHGALDGGEQCRRPLHLVQSHIIRQAGDETGRIGQGGLTVVLLVQADVCTVWRKLLDERCFPALPRSEHADDRRVGQSLPDYGFQRAGKQGTVSVHLSDTSAAN